MINFQALFIWDFAFPFDPLAPLQSSRCPHTQTMQLTMPRFRPERLGWLSLMGKVFFM